VTREETLELIDALLARARAVQGRLDEFATSPEEHISAAGNAVIDYVQRRTKEIVDNLTQRRTDSEKGRLLDDSQGWDRLQRRIRRYAQVLAVLHILLGFVVHSTREQVAEAIALMLEAVSARWFPEEPRLTLVQSQWHLNFHYYPISKLAEGGAEDIAVLSFPTLERSDLLLNCMLLHELGHQVDDVNQLSGRSTPDTDSEEWQNALAGGIPPDHLLKMAQAWLREIASDLIACATIGPCYFFAFAEFGLMFSGLDEAGERHPPARTRLQAMLRFIRELFSSDVGPFDQHLTAWEKRMREREPAYSLPPGLLAVSASLSDTVMQQLAQRVTVAARQVHYDGSLLTTVVPPMAEQLAELIPPSQHEAATCDVVSVANAAWLCYLDHRDAIAELLGLTGENQQRNVLARKKISDLAMTAIEHIYVRTVWELAADGGSEQG